MIPCPEGKHEFVPITEAMCFHPHQLGRVGQAMRCTRCNAVGHKWIALLCRVTKPKDPEKLKKLIADERAACPAYQYSTDVTRVGQ